MYHDFADRDLNHSDKVSLKERKSQKSVWFRCQIRSLIEVSLSITIPFEPRTGIEPTYPD